MRNEDITQALKFFAPLSRSARIHSNFVFRFYRCGLNDELAASSVGVDLNQIYSWDDGEEIPALVRRIWLYESGLRLPSYSGFTGWSFKAGRFINSEGVGYTERQLLAALIYMDNKTSSYRA